MRTALRPRGEGHPRAGAQTHGNGTQSLNLYQDRLLELERSIFNRFKRVHSNDEFEGTGIGLAFVRQGVERMGGSSGIESRLGEGSRFQVQLQAAPPPEVAHE